MNHASEICTGAARVALSPIARRRVSDDVLATLRQAIIAGAFAPGDHITESGLAQQLTVSRAPVREAMMQLEREGLLIFDRRGASFVKVFEGADLEEIFSLRLNLEVMAARLACRHLTPEQAAGLEENIARTRVAEPMLQLILLDVEFHDLVVQAAGHARLFSAWSGLRHQIEVWLARMHDREAQPLVRSRAATVRHHLRLLAALRSGSEAAAEKAIREHIEGWRRQFPPAPQSTTSTP